MTQISKTEIFDCVNRNTRNLRLKDFFSSENPRYDPHLFGNRFVGLSTWQPPDSRVSQDTLDAIESIETFTCNLTQNTVNSNTTPTRQHFVKTNLRKKCNLTPFEKTAIRQLKSNREIIIKPSDKGGAVVIMDTALYQAEGLRQLSNRQYYLPISHLSAESVAKSINDILEYLLARGFISERQFDYLFAQAPLKPRSFYLLPKVHKPIDKWPNPHMPEGRPIVSDCGSETERISEYIDFFLQPLACRHESFLRDSYDFVQKISNRPIPSDALIVTGDIVSLYTNMDIQRSLDVVMEIFREFPDFHRSDGAIVELLEIVLKNNEFSFAGKLYRQVFGTAMGKRFSPSLANIYLLEFDRFVRTGFRIRPLFYFRYIDDTFMIWPGTIAELREFEGLLNNLIPSIRINFVIRKQVAEFLDTTVYKYCEGNQTVLKTSVFFKPTDTHQLLHAHSFHPPHTAKGIVKSQLLRFKRICSFKVEYDFACRTLFKVLRKRGYTRSALRKSKREVWRNNCQLRTPTKNLKSTNLWPIIYYFDGIGTQIMKHTKQVVSSLNKSKTYRVVRAFRVHRNLKNMLVRSFF